MYAMSSARERPKAGMKAERSNSLCFFLFRRASGYFFFAILSLQRCVSPAKRILPDSNLNLEPPR